MDKKLTTIVGIAVGASIVAGLGIYKYFSSKREKTADKEGETNVGHLSNLFGSYIGNGLIKSNSLYSGVDNGLIGGGLYKA